MDSTQTTEKPNCCDCTPLPPVSELSDADVAAFVESWNKKCEEDDAQYGGVPGMDMLLDPDMSQEECDVFDRAEEVGGAEGDAITQTYCQAHADSRYAYLWAKEKGPDAEAAWLERYLPLWAERQKKRDRVLDALIVGRISRKQAAKKLSALHGYQVVLTDVSSEGVFYGPE